MKFFIKEARERLGISQKDLALALNIKPTTFNGYETGAHDPKSELLVKIAAYCNTSVDFLLGLQPYTEKESSSLSLEAQKIAKAFDSAKPREQEMVRLTLSEYLDETTAAAPPQTPLPPEAEAELANYRRELEAEQKGKTSYPTAAENGA